MVLCLLRTLPELMILVTAPAQHFGAQSLKGVNCWRHLVGALILNGDRNNFATVSLHGFVGVRCDTGMVVRRCYLRFLVPTFNVIHLFSVISVSVATFSGVSPKVFHGLFETLNNVVTGLIYFQVLIILNEILFLFASLSKKLPNLLTLNSLCLHRHQWMFQ